MLLMNQSAQPLPHVAQELPPLLIKKTTMNILEIRNNTDCSGGSIVITTSVRLSNEQKKVIAEQAAVLVNCDTAWATDHMEFTALPGPRYQYEIWSEEVLAANAD